MWQVFRSGVAPRRGSIHTAAAKQGKAEAGSAGQRPAPPPPPPTVAPKPAPERKPKARSSYRRRKKTDEERKQHQQATASAEAAARAGHEQYLDAAALAAKAAAVQATQQQQQSSQEWYRHAVQPLTDLVPSLLQHSKSTRSRSSSASLDAQHSGSVIPTLLVVDGFNLLHIHPSTKQLMQHDDVTAAQRLLQTLLCNYAAAQPNCHILLAYDAHNVPAGRPRTRQLLSDRVTMLLQAGKEADTLIIDLVHQLVSREAAAAAAGNLGLRAHLLCSLNVITNDNRIREAVTAAATQATSASYAHVVHIRASSSNWLSDALSGVERDLQRAWQQDSRSSSSSSAHHGLMRAAEPDLQHNTFAWAQRYLQRMSPPDSEADSSDDESVVGAADGTGENGSSTASSSSERRRHRRPTPQQEEALLLAAQLGDAGLLQLSETAAAAGVVAGAAAVLPGSRAEVAAGGGQLPLTPASLEGVVAGEQAALKQQPHLLQQHHTGQEQGQQGPTLQGPPSAAVAGSVVAPSTSQQLDDIISMDLDSLLPESLR